VLPPQLVRFREIVRRVHVKEQQIRICQGTDLLQWEDTDLDAVVEANGSEIAGGETG
jgi:hypothetical protein